MYFYENLCRFRGIVIKVGVYIVKMVYAFAVYMYVCIYIKKSSILFAMWIIFHFYALNRYNTQQKFNKRSDDHKVTLFRYVI